MDCAYSTKGVKVEAYRILVGKPDGKKQLGRPRRWCANNIAKEPRAIGWGSVEGLV
jgi:hypothetical protein